MNALMAFYGFNITLSKVRACKGIIVVLCDLYNKCSCMSLFSVLDFSLSASTYASCMCKPISVIRV